jgi:hypothetical protein
MFLFYVTNLYLREGKETRFFSFLKPGSSLIIIQEVSPGWPQLRLEKLEKFPFLGGFN